MFKRLFFLIIFIIQIISLNARFLDVAMFLDTGQELSQMKNKSTSKGPITLDLGVALCQKTFPILTTSSLLHNIQDIITNSIYESKYGRSKKLKDLSLNDNDWDIYQHRSKSLYLLVPKTYLNSLEKYNTPEFKSEAEKHPQFTSDEILTGFRINQKAGIFKKVSWQNLQFDTTKSQYSDFENWSLLNKNNLKNVNWLEIFTQGIDDTFGLWNILIDGHGGYPKDFLLKVGMPNAIDESYSNHIAGLSFNGYRNLVQFLTINVKTNFLYYTTCFGGDTNLILPYITTVLNSKGVVKGGIKKPNFTIAAGALTSESVMANSSSSLLRCSDPKISRTANYSMFFDSLNKYAPDATKAVIYKDKELKKILIYVTDRVKEKSGTGIKYGITALPSVMFPGTEIFRAIALDDKISVINEVLLKQHTLEIKNGKFVNQLEPIVLKNKEVILIYPLEIPVDIKIITEKDKRPPAIVAMTAGISITKINNLDINTSFDKFLYNSMGAVAPVFNKYFFINSLTTTLDNKIVTFKNVLILVKGINQTKFFTAILTFPDNEIYMMNNLKSEFTKLNIPTLNNVPNNHYLNSIITYFDSNDSSMQTLKKDFDFESLFKLLSKEDREILKQFVNKNGTFNIKLQIISNQEKAAKEKTDKDKALRVKIAKDKADKEEARLAKEAADKLVADKEKARLDKEKADKAKAQLAKEIADKEKADKETALLAKEKADKAKAQLAKEIADKEAKDKADKDKEKADKIKAQLDKEVADKESADKAIQDKADLDAKDKSDKEAADKIVQDEQDEKDKADKISKDKITKDKADKTVKDKIAKEKANKNLAAKIAAQQEKQFKDTTTKLMGLSNVFQEFKQAQESKNVKKINQLKKKVNLAQQNLKKLNVNIKNQNGQTPIMVNPRIAPVVYVLNKKVAKNVVNAKDPKGKTVLQYTIQSPFADKVYIYNALVTSGAKINNNDIKVVQNKLKNKPKLKNPIVKLLQIGQKKNK
ncbi:MAG: hypothetical protein P4L22_04130 [Candidatus Babeliales bacterium]|nr:hypothetical protein [Candidatus Babeliales bacterium]